MKNFPNGFTDWTETHFEIVRAISNELQKDYMTGEVKRVYEMQGIGGLYELAEQLTDEFEEMNKGREWDGEYLDAIQQFTIDKLK